MVALTFISYIFGAFIKETVTFIKGTVMFIKGAVMFIKGVIIFIGKKNTAIERRLFKIVGVKMANNIKGVNERDLKQQLITYKLKGSSLLINSLIFIFDYSIGLSL